TVMDNVKVLKPKVFNKLAIQFISTIWKTAIPNLGYSRHWTEAQNVIFKLPITSTGEPDWQYMENYMRDIMRKSEQAINNLTRYDS
ncbi:hypothetical protein IJJ97_07785, partial [bacterium]|nr:hypothetical protein [bacterium]